jgi:putative sterol carrier protein
VKKPTAVLDVSQVGEVKEGLRYFAEKANDVSEAKNLMNGWNRVLQFSLDGEDQFHLKFSDGSVSFCEGIHAQPDMTVTGAADVFYKVMNGELDRMKAFMTGQIKFNGSLKDAAMFGEIGDVVRRSIRPLPQRS